MIEVEVKLALTDSKRVEQNCGKTVSYCKRLYGKQILILTVLIGIFAKQMKHCECVKQRR